MLSTRYLPFAESLRAMTPDAASAARFLCDTRSLNALCQLGELDVLEISSDTDAGAHFDDGGRIVLSNLEGTLDIALDLARYPALQIIAASANDSAKHTMRMTLANTLLAALMNRLQVAGLGRWRVTAIERMPGDSVHGKRFDVALAHGGTIHRLFVSASGATLDTLKGRLHANPWQLTRESMPKISRLRITGAIALGARYVQLSALRSLRPGDVLLRTFPPAIARGLSNGNAITVRATWGALSAGMRRVHACVEIEDIRVTLKEKPFMSDEPLQEELPDTFLDDDEDDVPLESTGAFDDDAEPDSEHLEHDDLESSEAGVDAPLDIGLLDLPVQFEIDNVAIELAQLAALRPGYVIELSAPVIDTPVRLVTHGQSIGHGEIVRVGEHLGVRITRMVYATDSDK
ncbi:type III secretion system cytoplasmic ring protein SctQ [Burkholderia metallica]|uniref:type III secretion system cytoplasmic ring protein SctQ n=1 Tax=Burkholderia metallica TaxID=488729 RepID=UPI001CF4765B|nr:type III secretion system cytoplasmic ring protein SctQ [Burkholderia metallica]MCA8002730.1 type III secretion system cytoplasmic ring protein SctQ [Burkholderia metallica]